MIEPVAGIHNADPNAAYVNGDPATGQKGSIVPAEALEHVMREIVEVIVWSGQAPSHLDLTQLRKALKAYVEASLASNAGGIPLYEGLTSEEKPRHKIRPLIEGSNISFDLVEDPPSSGRYGLRISAAAAPGGGDDVPLENVGTGAQVFKGFSGGHDLLRSIRGINGISVTQDPNEIVINGAGIGAPSLAALAPIMIVHQTRAGDAAPQALPHMAWTRRGLNTQIVNQIPSATFSAEQITLPAGTYRAEIAGAAFSSGNHKARLQDITHGVTLVTGVTCDSYTATSGSSQGACNVSHGIGRFTLTEPTVIEMQHKGASSNTYGYPAKLGDNSNIAPETNMDGYVAITREAAA